MPRLTELDAQRLVSALSAGRPARAATQRAAFPDASVARLRSLLAQRDRQDELGHAITLDLASYLNRPVRCSVGQSPAPIANAWRFEADGPGFVWWLEFDAELGRAFADAMIGGDGAGHVGHGRRVRALAERVAMRMFASIASAAELDAPAAAAPSSDASAPGELTALAGGTCAVATDPLRWQVGVRALAPVEPEAQSGGPAARANRDVGFHPWRATPTAGTGADAVMRAAVDAFRARLEDVVRCRIVAGEPTITAIDGADAATMPSTSLVLALTAGGDGAVVVALNHETVGGLCAGVVGAPIPSSGPFGEVVIAAAEAIVRDALADAARQLPGIASDEHRIVRLSESALPAHTPHHAADFHLTLAGRSGELQLLVPSWMLLQGGS